MTDDPSDPVPASPADPVEPAGTPSPSPIDFDALTSSIFEGNFTYDQKSSVLAIINAWDEMRPADDQRRLAYALATAFQDTYTAMLPVEEIGKGAGRPWGQPAGPLGLVYYGRGYTPLRELHRYQAAAIALQIPFDTSPDLLLVQANAAAVLCWGMSEGIFAGQKLDDFFNGPSADWLGARAIVGGDDAQRVSDLARIFYSAL
jgi:hypothetical protein